MVVTLALFAPYIAPQNPYDLEQLDIMDNMLPPGSMLGSGYTAWLGTDDQGRDMLSAIIFGLRISLSVGAVSVLIASVIGASIGVTAAYFGKRVDTIIMRIVDLQLSFPSILVALVLLSAFGRGVDKVILALVIVQWAYYARTVRGSALVEKSKDYIAAASCLELPRSPHPVPAPSAELHPAAHRGSRRFRSPMRLRSSPHSRFSGWGFP